MDLFLGNYEVDSSEGVTKPSPLRQERDWKVFAVSAIEDCKLDIFMTWKSDYCLYVSKLSAALLE